MAADDREPLASEIMVPSTDPENKEEKKVNGEAKGKGKEESDVPDIVCCYLGTWLGPAPRRAVAPHGQIELTCRARRTCSSRPNWRCLSNASR